MVRTPCACSRSATSTASPTRVTYQAYRDKMAALMDRSFPSRASFVQAGVDDVASHLRPADPRAPKRALAVFPEDVGPDRRPDREPRRRSPASRPARTSRSSRCSARTARRPATTAPSSPAQPGVRSLILALTDTLYRSFYETFRDLAIEHGVYIAAAMNAPPARRVEASEDPALVALLRDPDEPQRTYAYEATSPYPDQHDLRVRAQRPGAGAGRPGRHARKPAPDRRRDRAVHPEGVPDAARAAAAGRPSSACRSRSARCATWRCSTRPSGRLAIVISKDAWMVDVNDRFATKGANVILQPEAFSEWAFVASPWAPDIFKEGGFANLQKLPEFRYNVDASLTGNFFDATFDGQSAIIGRKRKASPGPLGPDNAWIGQNPDTGFIRVGPWIEPDPGIANPALTLAAAARDARRRRLEAPDGRAVPGLARGRPVRERLSRDHHLGRPEAARRRRARTASTAPGCCRPASAQRERERGPRARSVNQRSPQVAARRLACLRGLARELGRRALQGLARRQRRRRPGVRPADPDARPLRSRLHPSVAADGDQVVVAWQEFAVSRDDDRGRIQLARFEPNGRRLGDAVRVDDTDASGKWLPAVALSEGTPVVAWIDERDRRPGRRAARARLRGARERRGHRLRPERARRRRHTRSALRPPRQQVGSGDRRRRSRRVRRLGRLPQLQLGHLRRALRRRRPHLVRERARRRLRAGERLNERPTVAFGTEGTRARRLDRPARASSRTRTSSMRAATTSARASRALASSTTHASDSIRTATRPRTSGTRASRRWEAISSSPGRTTGSATTTSSSRTARTAGASFDPSERVDDTGGGPSEQTRPRLAWSAGRCYVVWEDNRSGKSGIFVGRRDCPAS